LSDTRFLVTEQKQLQDTTDWNSGNSVWKNRIIVLPPITLRERVLRLLRLHQADPREKLPRLSTVARIVSAIEAPSVQLGRATA